MNRLLRWVVPDDAFWNWRDEVRVLLEVRRILLDDCIRHYAEVHRLIRLLAR